MKALLLSAALCFGQTQQQPQTYVEACLKAIEEGKQLRVFVAVPVEIGSWVSWYEPNPCLGLQRGVVISIPMDDWIYEIQRIERAPQLLPMIPQLVPQSRPYNRTTQPATNYPDGFCPVGSSS